MSGVDALALVLIVAALALTIVGGVLTSDRDRADRESNARLRRELDALFDDHEPTDRVDP